MDSQTMNFWTRRLFLLLSLFLGAGCGDDSSSSSPTPVGLSLVNYRLDIEDIMEFEQGEPREYPVIVAVPPGYSPTVTVDNLPEGASFDGNTIRWHPSCDLDFRQGEYFRGYMYYRVLITLKVAESPDSILQKTALLLVHKFAKADKICGG